MSHRGMVVSSGQPTEVTEGSDTLAHIAFFAPPAAGHINPTLGVVSELVARGHRVSFATTEDYAPRIKETGASVVLHGTTFSTTKPYELTGTDLTRGLLDGLRETKTLVPELSDWFQRDRPDLVLFDGLTAWWGRLLARHNGVDSIACWPNFVGNEHWQLTDVYIKPNKLDPRLWAFAIKMQRLASKANLTLAELVDGVGTGVRAQLVFLPRTFQFANETFGDEFRFVGPCLGERAFQGSWEPAAGDRPVCLVSLGTIYNDRPELFARVVDAFRDSPWHVVLVVGQHVDPTTLGEVPDNIEVRREVPQLRVLQRASLFITHAGMGSVMEALRFGVPMIALPQMAEQRANADRLEQLGLGRQLAPDDVSADALRTTAAAVSDNAEIRRNIAELQREMTETGGTDVAVGVIEEALPT